jgi:crotonobetainyl-CoA:carnitine CoA-transferase CaiB-like acyl-CoA transferase
MTGPMAAHPGFDYMVQGLAGWMSITGEPGGPPSKTGLSAVDFAAGYAAALALMTGLHQARRDGVGCDCDISLLETALSMLNYLVAWAGTEGYEPQRVERSGHPTLVPFQNFRTSDGWIVAGGSKEKFWIRMAEALGRGDLTQDPRFATFDDRLSNKSSLIQELDEAFAQKTTEHWLSTLEDAGVPCAPINSIGDALHDPQVVARDSVFTLPHPAWGQVTHAASPLRVGVEPQVRRAAPALGADTRAVLSGLLGYDPSRIAQLAKDGVIGGPDLM